MITPMDVVFGRAQADPEAGRTPPLPNVPAVEPSALGFVKPFVRLGSMSKPCRTPEVLWNTRAVFWATSVQLAPEESGIVATAVEGVWARVTVDPAGRVQPTETGEIEEIAVSSIRDARLPTRHRRVEKAVKLVLKRPNAPHSTGVEFSM
jgi:hypothetical protein